MELPKLKQIVEGAILAAGRPLTIDQMARLFGKNPPDRAELKEALEQIREDCTDRGFELKKVASGYRFQVRHELAEWISLLWEEKPPRYSKALLETLALIAYRQPLTRGDIEEIRGVSVSTNIMRSLLEREWIKIVGHRDVPGRPAMYATTRAFLDYFNLESLDELPTLSEIRDLDKINEELDLDYGLSTAGEPDTEEMLSATVATNSGGSGARNSMAPMEATMIDADDDVFEGEDQNLEDISRRVSDIEENIRSVIVTNQEDPD